MSLHSHIIKSNVIAAITAVPEYFLYTFAGLRDPVCLALVTDHSNKTVCSIVICFEFALVDN